MLRLQQAPMAYTSDRMMFVPPTCEESGVLLALIQNPSSPFPATPSRKCWLHNSWERILSCLVRCSKSLESPELACLNCEPPVSTEFPCLLLAALTLKTPDRVWRPELRV